MTAALVVRREWGRALEALKKDAGLPPGHHANITSTGDYLRVPAMTKQNDNTSAKRIAAEVGGPVDEIRVTLGIYGPEVQPDEISAVLRCAPTSSHRRGDARRPGTPGWPQGAWLLTVEGRAPAGPDEVVRQLLGRLPNDPGVWEQLAAKYTVRVMFGIFVGAWNRGFELSPASVRQLAGLGVPVGFDIYADGDEMGDM